MLSIMLKELMKRIYAKQSYYTISLGKGSYERCINQKLDIFGS